MATNIGGRAKRLEMTMQEFHEALDRSWADGFEEGKRTVIESLRDEIRAELEDELGRSDPDCPLCLMYKKHSRLSQQHESLRIQLEALKTQQRHWMMREGRYRYRQTR